MSRSLLFIAALLVLASPLGAEEKSPLPKEVNEAFEWFDTLGYPGFARLPFVRVQTGRWSRLGEDDPVPQYEYGVLLDEVGKSFVVFGIDLSTSKYTAKSDPDLKPWVRQAYEVVSIANAVSRGLERIEAPWNPSFPDRALRRGLHDPLQVSRYHPPLRFKLFVLARACAARGHLKLAHAIWSLIADEYAGDKEKDPEVLVAALRGEIGREMRRQCELAFADPDLAYADHLRALRRWAKHFGVTEGDESRPYIHDVESLAAEEARRAAGPSTPLKSMSEAGRIGELVYGLREPADERLLSMPPEKRPKGPPTAMEQLADIGFPAVPQLITGLDDHRPARGVEWRMGLTKGWIRPSFWVTTIADRCLMVLIRISGIAFQGPMGIAPFSESGRCDDIRRRVEDWWKSVESKGEAAVLRELVAQGGGAAVQAATRLMKRHADDGWQTVLSAAHSNEDKRVRPELVALLGSRKEPAVLEFLVEEARSSGVLVSRVTAAWLLSDRGDARGLDAMKSTFDGLKPSLKGGWGERGPESVLGFLLQCGDPAGIRHVAQGLSARPSIAKLTIIKTLLSNRWWASWPGVGREAIKGDGEDPGLQDPSCRIAAEDLLASLLDDAGEVTGRAGTSHGISYRDPKVADMAAAALARLFPDRYAFDMHEAAPTRARQRIIVSNVWRRARGRPLLPVPVAPKRDHLKHDNEVVEVKFAPGSGSPDKALREMLDGLVGKVLTADAFVGIVRQVAAELPVGTSGIVLRADRERGIPGLVLMVNLTTRFGVSGGTQKGWNKSTGLILGGKTVIGFNNGFLGRDYAAKAKAWDRFHSDFSKALAAEANASIEATIRLLRER